MTDIVDQPPPVASDRRPAWEIVIAIATKIFEPIKPIAPAVELVIADMRERDRVGRERYGKPLQANNGRRHLIDAYQEAQDKTVYLAAWLDEHDCNLETGVGVAIGTAGYTEANAQVFQMFVGELEDLIVFRAMIESGL